MQIKMGSCLCEINDDEMEFWENLSQPSAMSVLSDCIGIVMKDGSRYVWKKDTGLMFFPASMKSSAFYESFRS